MKRFIFSFIVLILLFGLYWNSSKTKPLSNRDVVKIGVVLPLSGDNAFWGEGIKNSLILANETIKSDKFDFELIFEDVKMDSKLVSIAANKLVNIDKVDAVISIFSSPAAVVNSFTIPKNIIHFAMLWNKAPALENKSTFAHWAVIEEEAKLLADYLIKKRYKSPALLTVNHLGFNTGQAILEKEFAKEGLGFTAIEKFNFGERDFKASILNLKAKNPDIYLVHCFMPELAIAIKQLRELGIDAPITGMEIALYGEVIKLFENQFFVNPKKPKEEFLKLYEKRFNQQSTLAAPNAYDIYNMLVYAYDKAEKKDNDKVINILSNIKNFDGVMDNFDMLEGGIVDTPVAIHKIKNGQLVKVEE